MAKGRLGGLGKGLDSLIPKTVEMPAEAAGTPGTVKLRLSQIEPNRKQPRKEFNEEALAELAESIRRYGVLQPLLVQKAGDHYEIVAGERRWRAARMAGEKEVPVIVCTYSEQETAEIALIENLQREDLSPLEEAAGMDALLTGYGLTQEELGQRLGKSRSAVTNALRLLKLPDSVQKMVADGQLTAGHARAVLAFASPEEQTAAAEMIVRDGLSVRQAEDLAKTGLPRPKVRAERPAESESVRLAYRDAEERLMKALGTRVRIRRKGEAGRIEVAYGSLEELERLMAVLQPSPAGADPVGRKAAEEGAEQPSEEPPAMPSSAPSEEAPAAAERKVPKKSTRARK